MGIHTKIVGVTKDNDDGVNRQDIIRKHCRDGMAIELVAEPGNKYDPNAIGVWVPAGLLSSEMKLGYLQSGLAADLAGDVQAGKALRGRILQLTGGGRDKNCGVNIEIETIAAGWSAGRSIACGLLVLLGLVMGLAVIGFLTGNAQRGQQTSAPPSRPQIKARASPAAPEAKEPTPEEKKAMEADAMLRDARRLDSFGRIQAGVEAYREVIKKFPGSKEAEFARTRLKAMGEDSK